MMGKLQSTLLVLVGCLWVLSNEELSADDFVWIEGEDATSSTMGGHGWYDSVKTTELSGGEWLSHFSAGPMPVARFEFDSAAAGQHHFWLRTNPVAARLSIRLNEGEWRPVDVDKNEQNTNIAVDGRPDLRFVAWVDAGTLVLDRGSNVLEVRFESENNRHGGLDCLVLSREPFFPQGSRKPGEKTGLAASGKWAFEPDRDRFSPQALLDLSYLNQKPAGRHGRVARSANGADFVDGRGEPIRFWAVNTGVQYRGDLAAVEEHARWLSKRGVNMVRHHGHLAPGEGSKLTDVNQEDIDAAWRLVAAMKEEGIYVTLSPYWAVSVEPQPAWNLKDAGGENLTGLIFFDTKLQSAYKGWLRELLATPNPHTGIPLAKDPAVAILQIQNEDSLLFWTESSIRGEQRLELGKRFGQWLADKYGSLPKAVDAWGGHPRVDGDDFDHEIAMPYQIWHLTQSDGGPIEKRRNDQLHFYTELMYDFNKEIARFLEEDLGYEGLVNAGNWRTADQAKLLDAERFAYSANDVIGVNRYYNGGEHTNPSEGNRAGYLISQGDIISSKSAIRQPGEFPLALRQVQGYPMIISESAWVPPLRYQTEGPFLVAAYSALTGIDIFYWFSTSDIGFGPPMGKWQLSTPAQLGMFPAAALMFRQGYVSQGKPVLVEGRRPEVLWSRQAPLLPEGAGFDPNRDAGPPSTDADAPQSGRMTPLAYLAGGVEADFDSGETQLTDLDSLIDLDAQSVQSVTGELAWDYGDGFCTLDAPQAKGIAGNLQAAGTTRLGTLTVSGRNEYACLLVVSMDGADVATSNKLLIQVGTTARPYGWQTSPAGENRRQIDELGGSPWNIEYTEIELQLENAGLSKATQLDANGLAKREIPLQSSSSGSTLELPADAMYLILE